MEDNYQSASEQEHEKEPQQEPVSGLLVRILDIPLTLFQHLEDFPTRNGPAELQEGAQNQRDSSPLQQEESRSSPPLMYQAGELANDGLTMIEDDRGEGNWGP